MNKILLFLVIIILLTQSYAWRRRIRIRIRRRRRDPCHTNACKWSWRSCSRSCGGGTQSAYITSHRGPCGPPCNLPSPRSCNTECCSVINCRWGSWGSWGSCSTTCGGGNATRTRTHSQSAKCGGSPCSGPSIESKSCKTGCCPVNCRWGSWSSWGTCTVSCGGGVSTKNRNFEVIASCWGIPCSGLPMNSKSCSTQCCPVDCEWDNWGEYSSCSQSCGSGIKSRTRSIRIEEYCGGSPCSGSDTEEESCNTILCPT